LKDKPQASAAISSSIQQVNVKPAIIFSTEEPVQKTFFRFMRFDAVISEVLDIAVFSIGMIPFEDVPVRMSHLCREL